MILKIKDRGQWCFIDDISEVVNAGYCLIENHRISKPQGQTVTPKRDEQLKPNRVFVWDCLDENGDGEGLCLTIYRKNTYEDTTIVVCEAYLMNEEGKTIEKMDV